MVSVGDADAFVVKYNTSGAWQWNNSLGGISTDATTGIGVDPSGNVCATGYFSGAIVVNGQPLASAGALDMFLVKYSNAGALIWAQRRGGTGDDPAGALAVDPSGNILVTGAYTGQSNLGGTTLPVAVVVDGFLAKYNSSGVHQWSFGFGGPSYDSGYRVTTSPAGEVILMGEFSAAVDVGGGVLPFAGSDDVFLARYTATGQHVWSRSLGGAGRDFGSCVALDAMDHVVVGGRYEGVVDFGGGNLASAGSDDGFLARYAVAEPAIGAIADIGNDQGRSVRITVTGSAMDDGSAARPIVEYQAFRRILPLPESAARQGDAVTAAPPGNWEFAAAVPANNAPTYHIVAPTLADSTITQGVYYSVFFVRAATSDPSVFFDSPVDSGYSADNLAPGVPVNFVYHTGTLDWLKSTAADFDYFSVYGSATDEFGTATLIDYTIALNHPGIAGGSIP